MTALLHEDLPTLFQEWKKQIEKNLLHQAVLGEDLKYYLEKMMLHMFEQFCEVISGGNKELVVWNEKFLSDMFLSLLFPIRGLKEESIRKEFKRAVVQTLKDLEKI